MALQIQEMGHNKLIFYKITFTEVGSVLCFEKSAEKGINVLFCLSFIRYMCAMLMCFILLTILFHFPWCYNYSFCNIIYKFCRPEINQSFMFFSCSWIILYRKFVMVFPQFSHICC